jgi:xylulokinase
MEAVGPAQVVLVAAVQVGAHEYWSALLRALGKFLPIWDRDSEKWYDRQPQFRNRVSGMPHILAHDIGTTGNKASLFDDQGRLIANHTEQYQVNYAQAGWAEQDPLDWWNAVASSTRALLTATQLNPADIAAVTFSGQMMGIVPIDAAGQPLCSAIIWADQRAEEEADTIGLKCGLENIYQRTGHRVSPAYLAAKILWVKQHQPDLYRQAQKFLCAKDFVAFKLTGQCATDYSDASGSNLFDLTQRAWSTDLIDTIGLDVERLPTVHASTDILGEVTREASEATGLKMGTPVVIGGGDGACATAGAGVIAPGDAYCNIGSSAWISFASPTPLFDPQQRTFTFHHVHPCLFTPMGTMQAAGDARDWLAHLIGDVSDAELARIPPGCEGALFLPYLIGERSPWWNPQARGAFVGLTMNHSRAALARTALEGVAFNLRLILDALESQGATLPAIRLIGGGAQSAVWQQILADVFARPIQLLDLKSEASTWGAAVAGGIGVGVYDDWEIARARATVKTVIDPIPAHVAVYADRLAVFTETYRALEHVHR